MQGPVFSTPQAETSQFGNMKYHSSSHLKSGSAASPVLKNKLWHFYSRRHALKYREFIVDFPRCVLIYLPLHVQQSSLIQGSQCVNVELLVVSWPPGGRGCFHTHELDLSSKVELPM